MENLYYDITTDLLYDIASEGLTGKERVHGIANGFVYGIIEPMRRLVDSTLSLIARAIAVVIPNDKIVWVSKQFTTVMKNAQVEKIMGYHAILKDTSAIEELIDSVDELKEYTIPKMKDVKVSFKQSSETPIKVKMGDFKKYAGKVMKYFKSLKTSLSFAATVSKTLASSSNNPEEKEKYKQTQDSLKALYKGASVINGTIVKTLVTGLFAAKKDDGKTNSTENKDPLLLPKPSEDSWMSMFDTDDEFDFANESSTAFNFEEEAEEKDEDFNFDAMFA